ncbi:MAG: Ltp family lipoprotein [Clostridia bacterium]|nr:Ltp family lipoprotein [Clostridia bacterium]
MNRVLVCLSAGVLLLSLTACGNSAATPEPTATKVTTTTTVDATTTTHTDTTTTASTTTAKTTVATTAKTTATTVKSWGTTPAPTTVTTTTITTVATTPREGACALAASYLEQAAFSYQGLIKQLKAGGCSYEDAVYAADNCGADWKEQAARRAQYHLDGMGYGRTQLIQVLLNDGFTEEEVSYALTVHNI